MLSLSTFSKEAAADYFTKDQYYVDENSNGVYYSSDSNINGKKVTPESFKEFLADRKVAAIDMTFSAPKSMSILAQVAKDDKIRNLLLQIHDSSVKDTLSYFESNIANVRLSYRDSENKKKYLEQKTGNIQAALFMHDVSRALDPQLHTHAVVSNKSMYQGKEYSLNGSDFFRQKMKLGKHYRLLMLKRLVDAGISVRIIDYKHMFFEVDGVSEETLDQFSKRANAIKLLIDDYKKKYPGKSEAWLKERINLDTRGKKKFLTDVSASRVEWENESIASGSTLDVTSKPVVKLTADELKNAIKYCSVVLTETDSTFDYLSFKNTFMQESLSQGKSYNEYDVKKIFDDMVSLGEFYKVDSDVYTTKAVRLAELSVIKFAKEGHGTCVQYMSDSKAKRKVNEWLALKRTSAPGGKFDLKQGQLDFISGVLTTKDSVVVLQGDAGTGKTTVLEALNDILIGEDNGYDLAGMSTTAKATAEIEKKSKIKARTIDSTLLSARGKKKITVSYLESPQGKKMYIVDESSMNSTLKIAEVVRLAKSEGARVVLIGDKKQLSSIGMGGLFEDLQKNSNVTFMEMTESIRQKDEMYKSVVEGFKSRKFSDAFKLLDENGFIKRDDDHDKLVDTLVNDYVNKIKECKSPKEIKDRMSDLILVSDNLTRLKINELVHDKFVELGIVTDSRVLEAYRSKNMTESSKLRARNYSAGDIIMTGPLDKPVYLTVTEVDPINNLLTMVDHTGSIIKRAPKKADVVHTSSNLSVGVGDRIVLLKNEYTRVRSLETGRACKVSNGDTAQIIGIQEVEGSYKIFADVDGIGKVYFDLNDYRYFTHAYALTVYKSQGQTVDNVYYIGNKSNFNEMYVILSRAKYSGTIYTQDTEALVKSTRRDTNKETSIHKSGVVVAKNNEKILNLTEVEDEGYTEEFEDYDHTIDMDNR